MVKCPLCDCELIRASETCFSCSECGADIVVTKTEEEIYFDDGED